MQPLSLSEKETGLQGSFSQCPWRHCHWLGQVSWGRRMSSGMDTLRFRLGSEKPEAQRSCFTSSTSSSLIHCSQHPVEPSVAATAFSPTALPLLYHLLVDTFSQAALSPRRLDQFISEITKGCKILKWLVLLSGAHPQPPEQLPPPTPSKPLGAAAVRLAALASLSAVWCHPSIFHLSCKSLMIKFHVSRTLAVKPLSLV